MWLKAGAVVALALLSAPAADNVSRPVPRAHATQLVERVRVEGSAPVLPWPGGAQAAVGATGFGVLAATPGARPLPTASVAKVMTALLTLEHRPLRSGETGPTITLTAQDVADYQGQIAQDGSTVPVVAGEQLTERQALEALLLPSANNIAILLARWIAGSVPAFVQLMNARARALGMTGTTFADSSGLNPATVSVPEDLVRLGQQAMTDPVFAQLVDEKEAVIPVAGTVSNVNKVLGQDGIVGIKTGNSDAARAVYLTAASYLPAGGQPLLLYAVVQGLATLDDCFAAARRLLTAVEGALRVRTIVSRGQALGRYAAAWGVSSPVVAGGDLRMLVWPGTQVTAELRAADLGAPAGAGQVVGSLRVLVGDRTAAVPASLSGRLPGPSGLWLLTRSVAVSTLPRMELLTWFSLSLAVAGVLLALAALQRTELHGASVRLRIVSPPAPDTWRVSQAGGVELTGDCVGLLSNRGSHPGVAWDFRASVQDPDGSCRAVAAVLPAARAEGGPERDAPSPAVIPVGPKSNVGMLVRLLLTLEGPSAEAALAALRRSPRDLRVSVGYGATRLPFGRPRRGTSHVTVPRRDLVAALEAWSARQAWAETAAAEARAGEDWWFAAADQQGGAGGPALPGRRPGGGSPPSEQGGAGGPALPGRPPGGGSPPSEQDETWPVEADAAEAEGVGTEAGWVEASPAEAEDQPAGLVEDHAAGPAEPEPEPDRDQEVQREERAAPRDPSPPPRPAIRRRASASPAAGQAPAADPPAQEGEEASSRP